MTIIFSPAGFGDRLLAEIKKLTPKDIKIRVCCNKTQNSIILHSLYILLSPADISPARPPLLHMDGVRSSQDAEGSWAHNGHT